LIDAAIIKYNIMAIIIDDGIWTCVDIGEKKSDHREAAEEAIGKVETNALTIIP